MLKQHNQQLLKRMQHDYKLSRSRNFNKFALCWIKVFAHYKKHRMI